MIDLVAETPLSLRQAAALFPINRNGRPVSVSCIFRWIAQGVRGPDGGVLRLEALRAGGRWITSREAVQRFVEAQTPRLSDAPPLPPSAAERSRHAARVAAQLDAIGI
jgi:hypothetical protein